MDFNGNHGRNVLASSSLKIASKAGKSFSVNFLRINRSVSSSGVFIPLKLPHLDKSIYLICPKANFVSVPPILIIILWNCQTLQSVIQF